MRISLTMNPGDELSQAADALNDMDYHIRHMGAGLGREVASCSIEEDGDDLLVQVRLVRKVAGADDMPKASVFVPANGAGAGGR